MCRSQWRAVYKAWTVFARSNTGVLGSNLTRGMDICVRLFCIYVVLCVGSGLATGWSPVQGVLPPVYRNKILINGQGPKGNRVVEERITNVFLITYQLDYLPSLVPPDIPTTTWRPLFSMMHMSCLSLLDKLLFLIEEHHTLIFLFPLVVFQNA
jgi:hypothetical protein